MQTDRLSMYVEIGYGPTAEVNIEEQLVKTIECLKETEIITDHKLISYTSILMDPAYVHVSEKSNRIKESTLTELSDYQVYSIGRYGDWKYCSIEDSMTDAINLAIKIS
ncbi:hypothetical protein [Vibrio taketomensis]|uniref:hypothetical protein n=1 Tax=Vibrio taketomensis TaxID=2572923 RepID=UPI0018D80916|nr:hypothetical protein [Vibrio taketomensis]